MKLLNQKLTQVTFNNVVNFCKEKIPEGVELDYKEKLPTKGLAKLIAAFSNKRGGLIIVGVKEDRKSGYPVSWAGMVENASLLEKIHQMVLMVTPPPSYAVHKTDSKKGKVFLLIQVDEGTNTPYFVKNDSNVWVRTGNIRNPVDIASPEWLELLYGKRRRAETSRKSYTKIAKMVFDSALEREEKKRLRLIGEAKKKGDGSEKGYYQHKLGTHTEMCTIQIQPFYPKKALIKPKDIVDKVNEFKYSTHFADFPNSNLEAIPEGVLYFSHRYDGYIQCQQIYSTGLFYNSFDVLTPDKDGDKSIIYLSHILGRLFSILMAMKSFYNLVGYVGNLKIDIDLDLKNKEAYFCKVGNNLFLIGSYQEVLLPKYEWSFTLSTAELSSPNEAFKKFFDIAEEIHWSLGFKHSTVETIKQFMDKNQMSF